MNLTAQDENGIVLMVLRDTYDILSHKSCFNFDYNAKVKLQKVVFLIADSLDIPLTRSWYRHGPFVHNKNVDFQKLSKLPDTLNNQDLRDIARAEKILSEIYDEYLIVLKSIVPDMFFVNLHELLVTIYCKYAPDEYKPTYLANLEIENIFQNSILNTRNNDSDFLVETDELTRFFSTLASNVAAVEDFKCFYDYVDEYTTILEKSIIKMNYCKMAPLYHLRLLKEIYEKSVWVPLSLQMSINTLVGLNADEEKDKQIFKLAKAELQIKNQLTRLTNVLKRDGLMASIDERTKFFKDRYGKDKDFVDALANVWKSYK